MDAYKFAAVEAEAATVAANEAVEDAGPKYESLTGFISGTSEATEELSIEMAHLAGATTAPLRGIGAMNVALKNHLAIVNNLTSTAIPAQIGLINTVQSSMGNVSAGRWQSNNSKWGDMKNERPTEPSAVIGASLGGVVGQITPTSACSLLVSGDWVGRDPVPASAMIVGKLKGAVRGIQGRAGTARRLPHVPRAGKAGSRQTTSNTSTRWPRRSGRARRRTSRRPRRLSTSTVRPPGRRSAKRRSYTISSSTRWIPGTSRVMESILGTVNEWKESLPVSPSSRGGGGLRCVLPERDGREGAGVDRGVDQAMFAEGGEAGQPVVRQHVTVAAFDRVGDAADRMAARISAAVMAREPGAGRIQVVIPRDAVTDLMLENSPSRLAWRGA